MARAQPFLNSHSEAHESAEEWDGITDIVARRKLQNRLNQRASRRRKAEATGNTGLVIKQWTATVPKARRRDKSEVQAQPHDFSKVNQIETQQDSDFQSTSPESTSSSDTSDRSLIERRYCNNAAVRERLRKHWELVLRTRQMHSQDPSYSSSRGWIDDGITLPADHLLTLIYYNVFRALSFNIQVLGLNEDQICHDVYPSPFLPMSPTASSALTRLPARLRPTKLQSTANHHAWTDIYPDPVIRDNIIKYGEENFDDDELCQDIIGLTEGDGPTLVLEEGPRTGVTVWGDPWELESWEISEALTLKWPWLFKGAHELEAWTNLRRASRGWKTISFA